MMNGSLRAVRIGVSAWWFMFAGAFPLTGAAPTTNAPADLIAQRLSLGQARRVAFERNWDLLAARTGIDSASAQLIVTKEFPNPTLSVSTAKIDPTGNGTPTGNGFWNRSYDTIVAVSQLLEVAGKRGDRQTSARAGLAGSRARFFDARRILEQGVTKAYV